MTDMAELQRRKQPLNLAIVHVDPEAFIANYLGWLEITAFITALRASDAQAPVDGATPKLTPQQLKGGVAAKYGNDAVFSFCMTAALKGDKAAVDRVDAALTENLGKDYPGSVAFWSFRSAMDSPVSLEDHVGQAARKMLAGDIPPPPMRARENWNAGLRFFEKARQSNFVHEITYPLALWSRARWTETLEKGVAFLAHIEDSVPALQDALAEPRNDQAFIANLLLKTAPAIEQDLSDDAQGFLRSLARRA
ncbi:hypothetical protein LG047_06300 [Methylocystis sp. WRRC1]|uniref:hypothetical protein n=1 Tax=Methylocystis sp. WRRC1 TaxID=1732014 RepID=UPI001D13BD44|nr:hypothetical protein [Methylocystis sp. WRRC1]MCC3244934.1 hypothetical protein [Methylocystis sp. WRRC1]